MLKKTFFSGLVLVAATGHFSVAAKEEPVYGKPLVGTYSQAQLLKNWALSYCIGQISTDQKLQREAGVAQGGYLEFGNQGPEAYKALMQEVQHALSVKAVGSTEADYTVMKCIDLFHGKPLDRLVRKLTTVK